MARKTKPYIWGACRAARDAEEERKARGDAQIAAAARACGGFVQNEIGRWIRNCPDCARTLLLNSCSDGGVGVTGLGNDGKCPEVPHIGQWLRDNGFGGAS